VSYQQAYQGSVPSGTRGAPTSNAPFVQPDAFQQHWGWRVQQMPLMDPGMVMAGGGTTYTDNVTGVVVLVPREVDTIVAADTVKATIVFTPREADTAVGVDSIKAIVAFTPRSADTAVDTDTVKATVVFTPRAVDTIVAVDAGRATAVFTPRIVDTYIPAAATPTGMAYRRKRYKRL
jgi:hypothetical protein